LDDLEGPQQPVWSAILTTAGLLVLILLDASSNQTFLLLILLAVCGRVRGYFAVNVVY